MRKSADDLYDGLKAKKQDETPQARKVVFNIVDTNMDGTLSIDEFFGMIKQWKVFNILAGDAYKQNPWMITNLDIIKNRNKVEKDGIVPGFPSKSDTAQMDALVMMTLTSEVNFKEFMALFKQRKTLRSQEIPGSMGCVSMVNLMVTLTRWDFKVVNKKQFMTQTSVPHPTGEGVCQNYAMAITWVLQMEQIAISNMQSDLTSKAYGLDLKGFEKIDDKLSDKASDEPKDDEKEKEPKEEEKE